MIKAKKGLLIALFAALMIFAFGATSAFASDSDAGHSFNGITAVDADADGLKVLVEPTCFSEGVGEITCTTDLNGEACGAVKTVKINRLSHVGGSQVKMTVAELMDYYKLNDSQKASYLAAHPTYCEKYVYTCENCGALVYQAGSNWYVYASIDQILDIAPNPWVKHAEPSDVKACAETYTCTECGVEDIPRIPTSPHTMDTQTTKAHKINDTTYVEVLNSTCTECGKVETSTTLMGDYVGHPEKITHGSTTDVKVPSETPCTVPNRIDKVCDECGMVVSTTEKTDPHAYQTTLPYAKGDGYMYVCDRCVVCGTEKNEHKVGYAPAPGTGSVTYEAVSEANCEQGTFILATSKDAAGEVTSVQVFSDTQFKADPQFENLDGKWYEKSSKTEVPFTDLTKHKFGQMESVAPATCTQKGFDARVCENCGKIDHSTVKTTDKALGHEVSAVVVPATCGAAGYTYNVCTRCSEYLSQDGKTVVAAMVQFDKTKPVVALGTECQYAWKVLEEATPFVMGTRAKVCTVCGDELTATKESIPKTELPAPAVKAKKKKAIVTVKEVEGAVSYQILVNGQVKVAEAKVGKNVVKKLKGGKKAKFQVVAIDASGNEAVSKAKAVKIKK